MGRYLDMLDGLRGLPPALFVTVPDVVGDAAATLSAFAWWQPHVKAAGHTPALVGQDGMTAEQVPWANAGAFFVGGSSEWKLSDEARGLVNEAKQRGLWVHMGRVNSHQRLRYAKALGCDSVDGTSLSWFRDTYLPKFLDHAAAPSQGLLSPNPQ